MNLAPVQTKLDVLKSNLELLERVPQGSFEEFSSDFRNVMAAIHLLQTSIQALIDLGAFLVATLALPTPRTSHEVIDHLEQAGHVPAGTATRFGPVIGFRNRVVHLYERVDERRVFEILTNHRRDLEDLLDVLLAVAIRE